MKISKDTNAQEISLIMNTEESIKLFETLKEAYESSSRKFNNFKEAIEKINWDSTFEADGESVVAGTRVYSQSIGAGESFSTPEIKWYGSTAPT